MDNVFNVLLGDDYSRISQTANRLDISAAELQDTYGSQVPWKIYPNTKGDVYIWTDSFIEKCQIAMTTDGLGTMSKMELEIWYNFIAYQEAMSTSAITTACGGNAIGCTIPDINGDSFVVCADGTITTELCDQAAEWYEDQELYKSLDQVFINMLACLAYNTDETIEGDIYIINPCYEG